MPDLRGLLADPEFNALPIGRRSAILNRINPALADEYAQSHGGLDFPGKESSMSAGQPQAWWEKGWDAARQAIFGSPDREEAKAAGLGLQPTPADMAGAAMAGGAFFGGPMAAAGALRGAGGVVGAAGRWAAANPAKAGAVAGAIPGVLHGDVTEAVVGAAGAAATGGVGSRISAVRKLFGGKSAPPAARPAPAAPSNLTPESARAQAQALSAEGRHEEARAVIDALRQKGSAAPVQAATAAPTPKPDAGRAAATAHNSLMAFAKDIAKSNPKVGQKIWILLDEAGQPVRQLTSDQAGAAARKGLKTTWVKNLWSAGL